jgi:hypothetical protein
MRRRLNLFHSSCSHANLQLHPAQDMRQSWKGKVFRKLQFSFLIFLFNKHCICIRARCCRCTQTTFIVEILELKMKTYLMQRMRCKTWIRMRRKKKNNATILWQLNNLQLYVYIGVLSGAWKKFQFTILKWEKKTFQNARKKEEGTKWKW